MKRVLLLSGFSRSGKNTVGDWLEATFHGKQFAFADPLKQYVCQEYQIPYVWTQTQEGKATFLQEHGCTLRDLLIRRGQEIRAEKKNPGFFAHCIADQIKARLSESDMFIITDWRLPEEIETIQSELSSIPMLLIETIRVLREGQTESPVNHWTETSLETDLLNYTYVVKNPGTTLTELYVELDKVFIDTLRK